MQKLTNLFVRASNVRISIRIIFGTEALSKTTPRSTLCVCSTPLSFASVDGCYWWAFTAKFGVSCASWLTFTFIGTHKINTPSVLSTRIAFALIFIKFTPDRWITDKTGRARTFRSMVSGTTLSVSTTNTYLLTWIDTKTLVVTTTILRTIYISLTLSFPTTSSSSISLESFWT